MEKQAGADNDKSHTGNERNVNSATASVKARLSTTHKILIGGFSLIIIAIVVSAIIIYTILNKKPETFAANTGNRVITEENARQEVESMQELVNRTSFRTYMNSSWTFKDGNSASSNAILGNNSKNTLPLYVKVSLEDTGELLFTSDVLNPGDRVKSIVLDTPLPKGNYTALCNYNIIDEDGAEYSSTSVRVRLSILN